MSNDYQLSYPLLPFREHAAQKQKHKFMRKYNKVGIEYHVDPWFTPNSKFTKSILDERGIAEAENILDTNCIDPKAKKMQGERRLQVIVGAPISSEETGGGDLEAVLPNGTSAKTEHKESKTAAERIVSELSSSVPIIKQMPVVGGLSINAEGISRKAYDVGNFIYAETRARGYMGEEKHILLFVKPANTATVESLYKNFRAGKSIDVNTVYVYQLNTKKAYIYTIKGDKLALMVVILNVSHAYMSRHISDYTILFRMEKSIKENLKDNPPPTIYCWGQHTNTNQQHCTPNVPSMIPKLYNGVYFVKDHICSIIRSEETWRWGIYGKLEGGGEICPLLRRSIVRNSTLRKINKHQFFPQMLMATPLCALALLALTNFNLESFCMDVEGWTETKMRNLETDDECRSKTIYTGCIKSNNNDARLDTKWIPIKSQSNAVKSEVYICYDSECLLNEMSVLWGVNFSIIEQKDNSEYVEPPEGSSPGQVQNLQK